MTTANSGSNSAGSGSAGSNYTGFGSAGFGSAGSNSTEFGSAGSGSPAPVPPLAAVIAEAADRGALGATAPALLLEVQAQLGLVAALAAQLTERGRRPFRPDAAWADALARLTFSVYNLADQTGVDVDAAARALARQVIDANPASSVGGRDMWPVPDS